jgi:hypothetical protein
MIKQICFIVSSPLYWRDYERYGAETLIENGFDVQFFDISPYMNPALFSGATKKDIYNGSKKKILDSKKHTLDTLKKLSKNTFIVVLLPHFNHATYHIFRYISKIKIPYAISVLSCIPIYKNPSKKNSLLQKLKRLKLDNIAGAILNKIFHPSNGNLIGIASPEVILLGGKASLLHQLFLLAGSKTKKLWLHNFDYDSYLKEKINKPEKSEHIITFIDAPSPRFKFDALIKGITSPLTEENYYPALCVFFDSIEREYGKSVEIAQHPKSEHEDLPAYYGFRPTFRDKTISMIRQSKIVVTRNSTSVNFIVLYRKPIIFHTSDEIEDATDRTMSNQIKAMATALNKLPININHFKKNKWDEELSVDKFFYDEYKDLYIKKKNSEDIFIWQGFANWINQRY